jgi:hypothetical protein
MVTRGFCCGLRNPEPQQGPSTRNIVLRMLRLTLRLVAARGAPETPIKWALFWMFWMFCFPGVWERGAA